MGIFGDEDKKGPFLWRSTFRVFLPNTNTETTTPLHFLSNDRIGLCVFGTILGCRRIFVAVNSRQPSKGTGSAAVWLFACSWTACCACNYTRIPGYSGVVSEHANRTGLWSNKMERTVSQSAAVLRKSFCFWMPSKVLMGSY